jgi:hypothetical protein
VSTEVPDWVRLACARWGRQKRRIWTGKEWYVNPLGGKQEHVDGYAESIMGRIKDERVAAAGDGARSQHWDEVYWGDALDVQRATVGMPEVPSDALHIKYVWDPEFGLSPRRKAEILGLKERAYWEAVGRAEFWIFARLSPAHEQVTEIITKISRGALKKASISAINRSHLLPSPELSFEALNRATISLKR